MFHLTSLHFPSHHYTSPNITTFHLTSLHFTSLHYTSPHITTLHLTSLHFTSHHYTSPHITTLQHISPHFTSLHLHTIFTTLLFLSFHPVYNCFPNSVSKNLRFTKEGNKRFCRQSVPVCNGPVYKAIIPDSRSLPLVLSATTHCP
jgi:hypothetical protein